MIQDSTIRLWAAIRLVLGILQMMGATASLVVLIQTGLSRLAFILIAATCLLTTISVLLFGNSTPRRWRKRGEQHGQD